MHKPVWIALLGPILAASLAGCGGGSSSDVVRVEAWTFNEPYGIRSRLSTLPSSVNLPPMKVPVNGSTVYLPSTGSLAVGTRALGSGSVMVHIQILKPTASSYRIYRRAGSGGAYELIGERANNSAFYEDAYLNDILSDALWFNDLDPALAVNQDYYYLVKLVDGTSERDSGNEYHVIILPTFSANLQTPANNAVVGVGTTPVFSWTASGGFGLTVNLGFVVYVMNRNDEDPASDYVPFSWLRAVIGATSAIYGSSGPSDFYSDGTPYPRKPLVPGAVYEWDLLIAYSAAMYNDMDFGESYAISFSYPRVDQSSSNGAFTFTTAP